MLQAHYRSILDFSDTALLASEKGFKRLMEAVKIMDELHPGDTSNFDVVRWRQNCYDAMNDDFNTPILIANLFEGAKHIHQLKEGEKCCILPI